MRTNSVVAQHEKNTHVHTGRGRGRGRDGERYRANERAKTINESIDVKWRFRELNLIGRTCVAGGVQMACSLYFQFSEQI